MNELDNKNKIPYYKIPKFLFTDIKYKDLSCEAKLMYSIMRDRVALSSKNNWLDENGEVYIFFTRKEAMQTFNCGKDKIAGLFSSLCSVGLIRRKVQGLGKPVKIYVEMSCNEATNNMNTKHVDNLESEKKKEELKSDIIYIDNRDNNLKNDSKHNNKTDNLENDSEHNNKINNSKNKYINNTNNFSIPTSNNSILPTSTCLNIPTSKGLYTQTSEVGKIDFPNNNNNNNSKPNYNYNNIKNNEIYNNNFNNNQSINHIEKPKKKIDEIEFNNYKELIANNINFDILCDNYDKEDIEGILELMTKIVVSKKNTVRISGNDMSTEVVKSQFLKLNMFHIQYIMNCLAENTTKIYNIENYLLTALYNAPLTIGAYYSSRVNYDLYGSK